MGCDYTPKYRLEFLEANTTGFISPVSWNPVYGKPTGKNLETFLDRYVESHKIGGVNEHISKRLGYIPVIFKARIINQRTEEVVADYSAAPFQVL